uniref:Reverse transcriptase domain-containing protein n=1 Tax=Populus alba TaxID=43335 RepID=A0A4U5PND8_POPAL|nr:hypothetical protein D5086_0000205730 [Populus alba]
MINWINACISSAFFSVGLNGSLHGFFPSSRGLRQGDPLPPYLFVIAMEGLGGILKGVAQVPGFQFHWRCKLNSITHLAFVDDLMVFCHADLASVELIRGALKSFSSISGSSPKAPQFGWPGPTLFFCVVVASGSAISLHPPLGLGENCFSAELGAKAILPPSLVMVGKPRFGWITGCQMVEEGRWAFPEGHADLLPLWNSINFLPQDHLPDHYIWRGHPSGQFNINTAWELIRESRPSNTFYHLIWFPGHVPRHAFILWIASLERLSTMDRLQSFRIIHAATCILCGAQEETHEHLFFQCPYSASVWREIARKSSITWPSMPWQHLLQWAAATLKSPKIFVHNLAKSILSTTVYFIWYEQNNRIFNNVNRTVQELGAEIFQLIRACLLQQDPNRIPNCFKNIWSLPES